MRYLSTLLVSMFLIQAQALTNSSPALDEQYVAVVRLDIPTVIGGEEEPGTCVGTLITKKYVMTAGHCVYLSQGLEKKGKVIFGRYKYVQRPDGTTVRVGYKEFQQTGVKKFHMSPKLQNLGQQGQRSSRAPAIAIEEDMAIVELESEVDLPLMPVATETEYQSLNNFSAFRTVSINYIAEVKSTDIKRLADMDSIKIDGNRRIISSDKTNMVEPGDSGGPLLAQIGGQWKLVGVVKGVTSFWNENAFAVVVGKIKY